MPTATTEPGSTAPGRTGEEGSATVEFILLAVLMLIPVIYFLLLTSQIQAAAYASVAAADQAAKAMVTAASPEEASARVEQVVALTLGDYGHGGEGGQGQNVQVSCSTSPCLEPGSSVQVEVSIRVPVPLIPEALGWDTAAATVTSSSVQLVPRFG